MIPIDLSTWNRREHFEFFSKMSNPFFGITSEIDCTKAYAICKEKGISFFAYYMHKSIMASNAVKELRYRIIDGKVMELPYVNVGTTIAREDGTFGFSLTEYSEDFEVFNARLQKEIENVQNSEGIRLHTEDGRVDLIRHTTIPWTSFSAILHPFNLGSGDSVPKIAFGKFRAEGDRKWLPISIEAHHGLADGRHLGLYFQKFQELMNEDF